jgi:hypothetical protein
VGWHELYENPSRLIRNTCYKHSTHVQARMNARRITFTPHYFDSSAFSFFPNLSL